MFNLFIPNTLQTKNTLRNFKIIIQYPFLMQRTLFNESLEKKNKYIYVCTLFL